MPQDEQPRNVAPKPPSDTQSRRVWQTPAVTRLDVVTTTLAKDGLAVDGATFDFS
jgi:hypothetical protein